MVPMVGGMGVSGVVPMVGGMGVPMGASPTGMSGMSGMSATMPTMPTMPTTIPTMPTTPTSVSPTITPSLGMYNPYNTFTPQGNVSGTAPKVPKMMYMRTDISMEEWRATQPQYRYQEFVGAVNAPR